MENISFPPLPPYLAEALPALGDLPGWCPAEKARDTAALVTRIAAERGAGPVVVELGVYGGRWTLAAALALKCREDAQQGRGGAVYAVDPWDNEAPLEGVLPDSERWWQDADMRAVHTAFAEAVSDRGLWPWVRVLHAPAQRVPDVFAPESVDLLHVDGNHSELSSCRDVRMYLPKVRPGGWVYLDDSDWATVGAAVRLLDETCLLQGDWNRYRLYRKP